MARVSLRETTIVVGDLKWKDPFRKDRITSLGRSEYIRVCGLFLGKALAVRHFVHVECSDAPTQRAMGMILLSALRGYLFQRPSGTELYLYGTVDPAFYKEISYLKVLNGRGGHKPLNVATPDQVREAFRILIATGFLEIVRKGSKFKNYGSNGPTIYKVLHPLTALLAELSECEKLGVVVGWKRKDSVRIKALSNTKKGPLIETSVEDLKDYLNIQEGLDKINDHLSKFRFSYEENDIVSAGVGTPPPSLITGSMGICRSDSRRRIKVRLYRVFHDPAKLENDAWTKVLDRGWQGCGGRFYGKIVNLKREKRKTLRLHEDGKLIKLEEIDISSAFPVLSYHLLGIESPRPERLYQAFSKYFVNDNAAGTKSSKVKLLWQLVFNTKVPSRFFGSHEERLADAIKSVNESVAWNLRKKELGESLRSLTGKKLSWKKIAREIVEEFCERFPEVVDNWMARSAWITLSNVESRIAEKVLLKSVARGFPVLLVHDGFYSPRRHVRWLSRAIRQSYREVVADERGVSVNKLPDFIQPYLPPI
ncbi:MAG: hypothetical protein ING65_08265 [Rhodocyclaceae bacterium]|nr:hypothetical protein [Rhodocyclaceae bacterium]